MSRLIDLSHPVCLFIGDSDGVMFWGDAMLNKIEAAYLNGTARTPLLSETFAHYYGFVFYGGYVFFTDWDSTYVFVIAF